MKKIIYVFIFFSSHYLVSQIYFDKIPPNKQLVPRDLTTNLGTISIEGEARTIGNDDLVYQNWGNNEPNNTPAPENVAEIIEIRLIKSTKFKQCSILNLYIRFKNQINY